MSAKVSWAALAAATLLAALTAAGCGGGVGSGGTGASVEIAQGTVSGFGSVIVDGQHVDDRVPARREDEPGVDRLSDVHLGDQVEIELDEGGAATHLRVQATLAGSVDTLLAPGRFVVLGQEVQVNADAALGPVTQFDGDWTGPADVLAGAAVEVHGVLVPQGGTSVVRATRIERLAALPAYLKVSGIVAGLSAAGFDLGALHVQTATAAVVPAGRALANGQLVTVLAAPTGRSGSAAAPVIVAAQVRIRDLAAGALVSVGGNVAALDAAARRFRLGALEVDYAGAALSPPLLALAEGQYVRVRGRLQPDGTLRADAVTLRDGRNEAEAELTGTVVDLDVATQRFTVRGVPVDARNAELEGCPNGVLAEGQFVQIEGALGATGVLAREVHCEDEPEGGTVGRKGVAGAVDVAGSRFVLTPASGAPVTVAWTSGTIFEKVTPQSLDGARVEVEGVLAGGVMTARKIERAD
ncbi:MAG: hypothetical protein KF788_15195 [Piscinibacter sp.]|nr:hypothetical protein [Piscinibacter sp.]